MSKHPRIFSFFSGAGFLDLGFETSGFKVDYINEIHKPFMDAYKYSRFHLGMDEPKYGAYLGSITDMTTGQLKEDLGKFVAKARQEGLVGFIGGPPCPDFSVGGKNKGQEGENGKLSASYIEVICQQLPDFFMFENVKGLWMTKKHRAFFEQIKRRTHEAGYVTTERLINALEYGVPQDRDRIIFFGFRRNLLTDMGIKLSEKANEISERIFPWDKHIIQAKDIILSRPWPEINPFIEESVSTCPDGIPKELTVQYWFEKNNVTNHPNAEHHFKPQAAITKFLSVPEGDDSKKSYKRLHRWRYSPTVCYGNNEVHLHPYKARRLSASEAMALQSLPKEFILPPDMSLTNMFKTIGNGVPYLTSKGLALTLHDFLEVIL